MWLIYLRVRKNSFMSEEKVKGPKSYFPSIEKTYGKPISHWMTALAAVAGKTHMEQVAFLKNDHAMGHGHANAIVHVFRAEHGGA